MGVVPSPTPLRVQGRTKTLLSNRKRNEFCPAGQIPASKSQSGRKLPQAGKTGCGRTQPLAGFVTGHEFTRAVSAAKGVQGLSPCCSGEPLSPLVPTLSAAGKSRLIWLPIRQRLAVMKRIRIRVRALLHPLQICSPAPPPPALPSIRSARPDTRKRVDQCDRKQHHLREPDHQVKRNRHQRQQADGMRAAQVNLLA
jgi:hypothetical protein